MVSVTRTYSWPMGHRLQDHAGLCRFAHGHNYRAEVTLSGPVQVGATSESGMVVDFSVLDKLVRQAIGPWDHAFMVQEDDPLRHLLASADPEVATLVVVPWAPTAENIAAHIGRCVALAMVGTQHKALEHCVIEGVKVWETDKSVAEWRTR